jgi:glutamate--cysteine ligase
LEVLKIARTGLQRRSALDRVGGDESGFLNVLQEIAQSGITPAEEKLALFHGKWNGSVDPIFTDYAY